ncbi:MAG TPA: hypothetical protein VFM82_04175 [Flavobacteriaceae bacterium]|nr:hypothetical protein [Flavobacteriaceae bacterium]
MISPKIIKAKGFWRSVIVYSLFFIVITNLVRWALIYKFDFEKFVSIELSEEHIFMFFVSNILLWIVLGFVLTYFNFKRNIREDEEEN